MKKNKLTQLGSKKTLYKYDYDPAILEAFANKHPNNPAWTSFICPEFTSLCPLTGQPDFAKITINYIADKKMVESKSLKLYLFSFRNHGAFHEDCTQLIAQDLFNLMQPHYLEVFSEFTPRGGIAIYPFVSLSSNNKKYVALKEQRFQLHHPRLGNRPFGELFS